LIEAARRAGVSAAAPYRHFADKAQLLAVVAEQGLIQLHSVLTAAEDNVPEPKNRVIELARASVRWAVAYPDYYQVMFGAETIKAEHPGLLRAGTQAFDDLLDAITGCQELGMMRELDPREIAGPMWSLVQRVSCQDPDSLQRSLNRRGIYIVDVLQPGQVPPGADRVAGELDGASGPSHRSSHTMGTQGMTGHRVERRIMVRIYRGRRLVCGPDGVEPGRVDCPVYVARDGVRRAVGASPRGNRCRVAGCDPAV
jgi:AcrR family transcriptional regulator